MKITRLLATAFCAAALLMATDSARPRPAAPNEPDTQSADTQTTDTRDGGDASAVDKQWENVQGWMREHCPNRVAFVQTVLRSTQRQQQARQMMIDQYNRIQKFPYKPMREAVTAEFEAQDQIFGAQWHLRQARRVADPSLQAKAEADLRAAVTHLFDAQQNMKRVQVKRHQEEIDRLKGEIDNQEHRRTQVVENYFKSMKNRADAMTGGGPQGPNGRTQNASPNDPHRPSRGE